MDLVQHHCANLMHSTSPYLWPALPSLLLLSLLLFFFFSPCFPFSLLSPQRNISLLLSDQGSGNWVSMLCGRAIYRLHCSSSQFWSPFWSWDLDLPSTESGIWALRRSHNEDMSHRCVPRFMNCAPSASALDLDWQLSKVTGNLSCNYTLLHYVCCGRRWPCCPTPGLEKAVRP